ncbi:MAG: SGNH/GDSL hydrolase family protein [Pseudomonadota bacterium]
MSSDKPLVEHSELYKLVTPSSPIEKTPVTGVVILGDSLSDPGGKNGEYGKKLLGCIPIDLFLHKSPHKQFTNGFVWSCSFFEMLRYRLKEKATPVENPNLDSVLGSSKFSENLAQGGSTAYDYSGFFNFFKHIKGFFLSFFLNNIQRQAKKLKKIRSVQNTDLCLIFAGANDFLTVGYDDVNGATRAIDGVSNTLKILTTPENDVGKLPNATQNAVLFTLPDFSKTPRFSNKSDKVKKQAQKTCKSFNDKLRKLAESYQCIDFSFCDIYQIPTLSLFETDPALKAIRQKGVLIVGTGEMRQVYFVENHEYIEYPLSENDIVVDIKLSKSEQKLLDSKTEKIERTQENTLFLDRFVQQLVSKAKLNANVKIFDAAAVFEEIDQNPEQYGFTSGCAVYYLESEDIEIFAKKITSGNAVIFRRTGIPNKFSCYFVKAGKLLRSDSFGCRLSFPKFVRFQLSETEQIELDKKLKEKPLKEGISQLAAPEDKHDVWTTHIVQYAVEAYDKEFNETIQLTDVYTSILMAIKKHYKNDELIFWDDLHPTVIIHFLLELMFEKFFEDNYTIENSGKWSDDTAILSRVMPKPELPPKSSEAPARMYHVGG